MPAGPQGRGGGSTNLRGSAMDQSCSNSSGLSGVDLGIAGTRLLIGENETTSQTTFRFFLADGRGGADSAFIASELQRLDLKKWQRPNFFSENPAPSPLSAYRGLLDQIH